MGVLLFVKMFAFPSQFCVITPRRLSQTLPLPTPFSSLAGPPQAPDQDLGRSKHVTRRGYQPPTQSPERPGGLPTVRLDIAKPKVKRVTDFQNYGDEVNADRLIYPSVYAPILVHPQRPANNSRRQHTRQIQQAVPQTWMELINCLMLDTTLPTVGNPSKHNCCPFLLGEISRPWVCVTKLMLSCQNFNTFRMEHFFI